MTLISSVQSAPFILAERRYLDLLTVKIVRNPDGTLSGQIAGNPVPLKGALQVIPEALIGQAAAFFSRCGMAIKERSIVVWPNLRGGGESEEKLASANEKMELVDGAIELKDFEQAANYCKEALQIKEEVLGKNHLEVASVLFKLGEVYDKQEKFQEAFNCHTRALEIRKKVSPDSIEVGDSLQELGRVCCALKQYEQAESYFRQALAMREKHLGAEDEKVGRTLNGLVYLSYEIAKGTDEALEFGKRAVAIFEKAGNSERSLQAMANLAALYIDKKMYEEAETYFKKILEGQITLKGEKSQEAIDALRNLGMVDRLRRMFPSAIEYYERALNIALELHGERHKEILLIQNDLGLTYWRAENYDKAIEHYTIAIVKSDVLFPPDKNTEGCEIMGFMARIFKAAEKHQPQSLNAYKDLLRRTELAYGKESKEVVGCLTDVAQAHIEGTVTQKAMHQSGSVWGASLQLGKVAGNAHMFADNSDWGQAVSCMKQALSIYKKLNAPSQEEIADMQRKLGLLHLLYDLDSAESYFLQAVKTARAAGAPNSAERIQELQSYVTLVEKARNFKPGDMFSRNRSGSVLSPRLDDAGECCVIL